MRTARLAGSAWLVAACAVAAATLLVVGCSEARPSQATPTLTPSAAVTGTVPTLTTGPSRSPEIVLPSLALTPAPSPSPQQTPPPSLQPSSNTAITAGAGHSCALRADGTVWCWGGDGTGALGDGTRGDTNHLRLVPVQVVQGNGQLTGVTEVSSSVDALHTCALEAAGTVWCWGDDYLGQLGDGTTGDASNNRLTPVQVVQSSGPLTAVEAIAADGFHSCALTTDTTVWCWGSDVFGQLGDGMHGDYHVSLTPVQVVQGGGPLTDVEAIAAGSEHTCALKTDATVWCWGHDVAGQLGDGTAGDADELRLDPVQVVQGSGPLTDVQAISAGYAHTCALKSDGTVWCWGADGDGALGDGTTGDANQLRLEPVQVVQGNGKLTDVKAITTGEAHTCALKADGTVWCWGDYFYGQLGDGTMDNADAHLTPVQVVQGSGLLTDVEAIAAGLNHTCALKTDATIWCWGDDSSGQLGDGTTGDENQLRLEPVQVIGLS
jgi:alpha-tubulin suppressor-like RCC1 family protein